MGEVDVHPATNNSGMIAIIDSSFFIWFPLFDLWLLLGIWNRCRCYVIDVQNLFEIWHWVILRRDCNFPIAGIVARYGIIQNTRER